MPRSRPLLRRPLARALAHPCALAVALAPALGPARAVAQGPVDATPTLRPLVRPDPMPLRAVRLRSDAARCHAQVGGGAAIGGIMGLVLGLAIRPYRFELGEGLQEAGPANPRITIAATAAGAVIAAFVASRGPGCRPARQAAVAATPVPTAALPPAPPDTAGADALSPPAPPPAPGR